MLLGGVSDLRLTCREAAPAAEEGLQHTQRNEVFVRPATDFISYTNSTERYIQLSLIGVHTAGIHRGAAGDIEWGGRRQR